MCEQCDRSLGEIRERLSALARKLEELEQRIRALEGERMVGSVEGLEGEWTVTPPPQWEEQGKWHE